MSDYEALINIIHREVQRVTHRTTRRTPVVVDSYDKQTFSVKLKLQPDSGDGADGSRPVITGWIPLTTAQTGKQTGHYIPPNIGDHGWLEFHEDDREAANFVGGQFNDVFQPAGDVEAGEHKYIHPGTKTQYYYDKNGNIFIRGMMTSGQDNSKQTIVLKNDGSLLTQDKTGVDSTFLDGNGNYTVTST